MMSVIPPKLVLAARAGDEIAQAEIFKQFEDYIKGWAWRESRSSFWGTIMDADDIANMLRERVWLAVTKFQPYKRKNSKKNFIMVAKAYMAAGMWAARKKIHRNKRMRKVVSPFQVKDRWVRKENGLLVVKQVRGTKKNPLMDSVAPVLMSSAQGDDHTEVERLVTTLRTTIDFDFDIFLAEMKEALAKQDPFLPQVLQMLWDGFSCKEIAAELGSSLGQIKQLVFTDLYLLSAQLQR